MISLPNCPECVRLKNAGASASEEFDHAMSAHPREWNVAVLNRLDRDLRDARESLVDAYNCAIRQTALLSPAPDEKVASLIDEIDVLIGVYAAATPPPSPLPNASGGPELYSGR